MRLHYTIRCAQFCTDRKGNVRWGDRWVHIRGKTLWVCEPCADKLGRENGIASSRVRRTPLVLKGQMTLPDAGDPHLTAPGRAG